MALNSGVMPVNRLNKVLKCHRFHWPREGDLASFAKPDKRISHVGIIITSESIIHNLDYVRIDGLDNTG